MTPFESTLRETIDHAERQVKSGLRTAEETTAAAAVRVLDTVRPFVPAQAAPIVERVPDPERLVGAAYGLANDILSANRRYATELSRAVSKLAVLADGSPARAPAARSGAPKSSSRPKSS